MDRDNAIRKLESSAELIKKKLRLGAKRPLFIEFAGTPKAGKTTVIRGLDLFLRRNGFSVKWLVERASTSPITNKQHMFFNVWTSATTLSSMLAALEEDVDVIIMDRGLFDSIVWMNFLRSIGRLQADELETIQRFLLMKRWSALIDIVFVMTVDPETALQREYKDLLTRKEGSIMRGNVLPRFNTALAPTEDQVKGYFKKVITIDTSKDADVVTTSGKVVEVVLDGLNELLSEVLAVVPSGAIQDLSLPATYTHEPDLVSRLERLVLERAIKKERSDVEEDDGWIQPIICAIFRNNGRILCLRKKERLKTMRFHRRLMIWVGGHLAAQDLEAGDGPFLHCLRRELDEELDFTADASFEPLGVLWDRTSPKSRRHLGLVYEIDLEDKDVAETIQNQGEFYERKGRSISCSFVYPEDLKQRVQELEPWTAALLGSHLGVKGLGYVVQDELFEH